MEPTVETVATEIIEVTQPFIDYSAQLADALDAPLTGLDISKEGRKHSAQAKNRRYIL